MRAGEPGQICPKTGAAALTDAERDVVEANLALVGWVLARTPERRALEPDDAFQEGCLGLIRAVKKFDPARGTLATYAAYWIRSFVRKAADREARRSRARRWPAAEGGGVPDVPAAEPDPGPDDSWLAPASRALSRREWAWLARYFGLGGVGPAVMREIAAENGVTARRVQQVISGALDKLRRELLADNGGGGGCD